MSDVAVVGGGIVGLATARELALRGERVTVFEREREVALHQTGRNSGVVHAGIYYSPGSLKAELCRRGARLLRAYCAEHALPYEEVGKLVIAATSDELPRLDVLERRATLAGVPGLERIGGDAIAEFEPNAVGVAALHSPTTAITDFVAIAHALAAEVGALGGEVHCSNEVATVTGAGNRATLTLASGESRTFARAVVCAGLWSSRLAARSGAAREPRIVPFRGEYLALKPGAAARVRGLIYPVPDPALPFLGVHLTRRVDGSVLIGPSAVPALALTGYRRRDVDLATLRELALWPGARRLARRQWRHAAAELAGSIDRRRVVADAARYLPGLGPGDVTSARSGVRAQAVSDDGQLIDDFVLETDGAVTRVRNAPSPAATSSLAIAERIAERVR